jgi:integrase
MKGCRPLTEKEIGEVLISFNGEYAARDKALFVLGLKTGFRVSELLSLKIGDIFQRGRIVDSVTVRRQFVKQKTEGRTVKLNPQAKTALRGWIDELRERGKLRQKNFLFPSRKGDGPITRVQAYRILKSVFDECEITGNLGTHSMRKSFAASMREKLGKDLFLLQKALGHKNVNSTVSYLSFCQEEIDEAILSL